MSWHQSRKMPDVLRMHAGAFERAEAGAHHAATSCRNNARAPTPAMAAAGNYRMGRIDWHGFVLRIENPVHTERCGVDPDGKAWRSIMKAHYGYFAGVRGADGDGLDVFVGPVPASKNAWIINQLDAKGGFDEHKVMVGFADAAAARTAYVTSYSPGWNRFRPPIPVTLEALRRWCLRGNKRVPYVAEETPMESTTMTEAPIKPAMPVVFWDHAADPLPGLTWGQVLYAVRAADGTDGLILDPLTMADVMEGEPRRHGDDLALDALVVEAGRLQQTVNAVTRVLTAAAGDLTVVGSQISDPVRRMGAAHLAVIWELSDGQTITMWLHKPGINPAKLTIMDELVSWKWQLNKLDVTVAVAPEKGVDLNPREVARRLMRMAGKNSAAFARSNAKRAQTMEEIAGLKSELATKQGVLTGLLEKIEVAKVDRDDRAALAAAGPEWRQKGFDPTTADNYRLLMRSGEDAMEWSQDVLDSLFQERLIEVRNALRTLGWNGEKFKPLSKGGATLVTDFDQVGAGRNIVGVVFRLGDKSLRDDLSAPPQELAAMINDWAGEVESAAQSTAAAKEAAIAAYKAAIAAGDLEAALAAMAEIRRLEGRDLSADDRAVIEMKINDAKPAPVVTPEPAAAKFWVMLGDKSVSEHPTQEAAATAAQVVADTDPFAHEGVWIADADGNEVQNIREAGLAKPEPAPPVVAPTARTVRLPGGLTKAQAYVLFLVNGLKSAFRRKNAKAQGGMSEDAFDAALTGLKRMGALSTNGGIAPLGESLVTKIKTLSFPDQDPKRVMSDRVTAQFYGAFGEPTVGNYGVKRLIRYVGAEDPEDGAQPADDGRGVVDMLEGEFTYSYTLWMQREDDGTKSKQVQGMLNANSDAAAKAKIQTAQSDDERRRTLGLDVVLVSPAGGAAATEDPSDTDLAYLREVNTGAHDAAGLDDLLSKITASVEALNAAGKLTGETEGIANAAITRWVDLDQKLNG